MEQVTNQTTTQDDGFRQQGRPRRSGSGRGGQGAGRGGQGAGRGAQGAGRGAQGAGRGATPAVSQGATPAVSQSAGRGAGRGAGRFQRPQSAPVVGQVAQSTFRSPRQFKMIQYSYLVKSFTPTQNSYSFTSKNDLVFVNLKTKDERTQFYDDMSDQGLTVARDLQYRYFVSGDLQLDGANVTFASLQTYIKGLIGSQDDTKDLKRSYMITPFANNFKVSSTSYDVSRLLTADDKFAPFKRASSRGPRRVATTTSVETEGVEQGTSSGEAVELVEQGTSSGEAVEATTTDL